MRPDVIALTNLKAVVGCVVHIDRAFDSGNEAGARDALRQLAAEVGPALPKIIADLETAQARDRTERTLAPFFRGKPAEHLNASNDHGPAPSEPAPSIA